jgi:hypothetical protein
LWRSARLHREAERLRAETARLERESTERSRLRCTVRRRRGDHPRLVGEQEQHHRRDVLDLGEPLEQRLPGLSPWARKSTSSTEYPAERRKRARSTMSRRLAPMPCSKSTAPPPAWAWASQPWIELPDGLQNSTGRACRSVKLVASDADRDADGTDETPLRTAP